MIAKVYFVIFLNKLADAITCLPKNMDNRLTTIGNKHPYLRLAKEGYVNTMQRVR